MTMAYSRSVGLIQVTCLVTLVSFWLSTTLIVGQPMEDKTIPQMYDDEDRFDYYMDLFQALQKMDEKVATKEVIGYDNYQNDDNEIPYKKRSRLCPFKICPFNRYG